MNFPKTVLLLLICFFAFFYSRCSDAAELVPAPDTFQVKLSSLDTVPEGLDLINASLKFSLDMQSVSYVAKDKDRNLIVRLNNTSSPKYKGVQIGTPFFSLKSFRHAYIAFTGNREIQSTAVIDGNYSPSFYNIDHLFFSPDGSRYVFRATNKQRLQGVSINGRIGNFFSGIPVENNFKFSMDSKHFVYVAKDKDTCSLFYDGKKSSKAYNYIKDVTFSNDSSRMAYKARIKPTPNEKWCVVLDGEEGPIFDHIFDLIFSYDSQHFAYVGVNEAKKQFVLLYDKKEIAVHDQIGFPVISMDGKRFAYAFSENKKWYISIDGQQTSAYDSLGVFSFSYDSKHYAYSARKGNQWFYVIDGNNDPEYKNVSEFQFTIDSKHYAYAGISKNNNSQVVTDMYTGNFYNTIGTPYFSIDGGHLVYRFIDEEKNKWGTILDNKIFSGFYESISPYEFSPDGNHLAFYALKTVDNKSKSTMVVDGIEYGLNKLTGKPFFSPDGQHIVYVINKSKDEWYIVVDDKILSQKYNGFMKGMPFIFDDANHFKTIGMRLKDGKTEFLSIEVKIPENTQINSEI